MAVAALPALLGEQRLDPVDLGIVITIFADDAGPYPALAVDHQLRADQVIESHPPRDRPGIKFVGSGNQHQRPAGSAILLDLINRFLVAVGAQHMIGKTLDVRLQFGQFRTAAHQQPLVEGLQLPPADQLEAIAHETERQ